MNGVELEAEGLEAIENSEAVSREGREIAAVARHQRFTLGGLAKVFNERFGLHIVAANISRYLNARRVSNEQAERFCDVLGMQREHLIVAGQHLSGDREAYWREHLLRQFVDDFVEGTAAKIESALSEPDGAETLRLYALMCYRESLRMFDGKGLHGTSLREIAPGYRCLPSEAIVVERLRGRLDISKLRRKRSRRDTALADIFQALHGLISEEQCGNIVAISRTAIKDAGHDVSEMELRLLALQSAIAESKSAKNRRNKK